MATSGEREADESKSHNVPILTTSDASTADSSSQATEGKVSKELHKQMRPTWPISTTPRRAYRAKMGDVAIDIIKDREERSKVRRREEPQPAQGTLDYNHPRYLPQKPQKHLRNVFTRMEDSSVGPFSLLYRSVKEKRKVKVWTRSYRFVRGICTGYLVAYDKHCNLAMSDVDEVYKNPALKRKARSGAEKRHNKRTKEKTYQDCGVHEVAKDADVTQDGNVIDTERQQLRIESAEGTGTEATSTKLASSKYPSLKDNSSSEASTSDNEDRVTADEGRDDKSSEEQLSRVRESDEEEDLDSLALRLSRLKEELGEISLTEDPLAEGPLKAGATDDARGEAAGNKQHMAHKHKTSSSCSDDSKQRAGTSRRCSRSESDRLLERDRSKNPRGSLGKKERGMDLSEGHVGGSRGKETVSSHHANVEIDCAKGSDELLERHVNQLFIRGDNVVMISLLP